MLWVPIQNDCVSVRSGVLPLPHGKIGGFSEGAVLGPAHCANQSVHVVLVVSLSRLTSRNYNEFLITIRRRGWHTVAKFKLTQNRSTMEKRERPPLPSRPWNPIQTPAPAA